VGQAITPPEKRLLQFLGNNGRVEYVEDHVQATAVSDKGQRQPISAVLLQQLEDRQWVQYDAVSSVPMFHVYVRSVEGRRVAKS
jgi:hypothetical protein